MDDDRATGQPGERRLQRPPSDRYEPTSTDAATSPPDGSPARGIALGTLLAIVGAVAITIGGGILAITAGLIVIAAATGWAVAVIPSMGAGAGGAAARRRWPAIALAIVGVALGQLGLWLLARQEGGTLGLIDYLGETFGYLVPLQVVAAVAAAWWWTR